MPATSPCAQSRSIVLLSGKRWLTTRDLVRQVARHQAWCDPTGKRLPRKSLRRIINRELTGLKRDGVVEIERSTGKHGQRKHRYRALPRAAQRDQGRSESDRARDEATP